MALLNVLRMVIFIQTCYNWYYNSNNNASSRICRNFSEQLHFRRTYFFIVSTSSQQLVLQSNKLDKNVTFSEYLFLQSCYFFWIAFFKNCQFFSVEFFFQNNNSLEWNFFRADTFSEDKPVQNKDIYRGATFSKQVLLYSIKYFRTAAFSTKVPFKNSYYFRKATFWKQLMFQKSNIPQLTFSEEVLFKHSCTSYL